MLYQGTYGAILMCIQYAVLLCEQCVTQCDGMRSRNHNVVHVAALLLVRDVKQRVPSAATYAAV
jgi:hypothetical protein